MNTKRTVTRTFHHLLAILFCILSGNALGAQFQSSSVQIPLIELYTSEGCSSCPPADRWLSAFADDDKLWKEFVPVAFHVDYWDYIGWKDEFAKPSYSERQRQYAREGGSTAIYTPGVRKAGDLWNAWRLPFSKPEIDKKEVGALRVAVSDDGEITANLHRGKSLDASGKLTLYVAVLGLGLETEVKRGENRGKRLKHDFVVLDLVSFSSLNDEWRGQLPRVDIQAPRYAIAAWVSAHNRLAPLQATGGPVSCKEVSLAKWC